MRNAEWGEWEWRASCSRSIPSNHSNPSTVIAFRDEARRREGGRGKGGGARPAFAWAATAWRARGGARERPTSLRLSGYGLARESGRRVLPTRALPATQRSDVGGQRTADLRPPTSRRYAPAKPYPSSCFSWHRRAFKALTATLKRATTSLSLSAPFCRLPGAQPCRLMRNSILLLLLRSRLMSSSMASTGGTPFSALRRTQIFAISSL